jgi:ADP-ribose pyrophosphatase YjhB (NUDIX family)
VLRDGSGAVFLTKRAVPPCEGLWHLPGGTVRYAESLFEAVRRIALHELGVYVRQARSNGHIEYPSHYTKGLDSPVGIVFEVTSYSGAVRANVEAEDGRFFSRLPADMHADQDAYLVDHRYLSG